MSIFQLLIQFVFRVTFGVALALGVTPSRLVTSGFYRVHLWVLMGLNTLASLTIYTQREALSELLASTTVVLGLAVGLAVASYFGSVLWLYEKSGLGLVFLIGITLAGLVAAAFATPWTSTSQLSTGILSLLDVATSGLLLGVTLSAMFLGHWYLNSPTMQLMPLRRLVIFMLLAVAARMLVCGTGLAFAVRATGSPETVFWIFVALRWLSGLCGVFLLGVLTWYTLKIPNTQSATGILYAGVILAFIGELTSQFLTAQSSYPI